MERIDLHLGIGRDSLVFQHGWDVYNFSWNSINLPAMIDAFHVSCVPVHFAQRQWGWPMWALIRHTVCLAGQISPKDQRISQKRCRHGTCCSRANLSSFGFGKIIAEGYGIPLLSNIQRQVRMEQATRDIFGPLRGRKQRLARIRHGINFFSRLKVCSNNSEFKAATVDLLGTKRNGYSQALGPRQYIQFVRFLSLFASRPLWLWGTWSTESTDGAKKTLHSPLRWPFFVSAPALSCRDIQQDSNVKHFKKSIGRKSQLAQQRSEEQGRV